MSVYTNWHDGRKPGAPFNHASPNLRKILEYCHARWGLTDLGCYAVRPIRGGTRWSAHAFGAAQDLSYRNSPSRDVIVNEVIPFLEQHALTLGIQRIHDYYAKRYWQAGKGWVNRPPGNGYDWLHIETTAEAWEETRSVEERIGTGAPVPKPSAQGHPVLKLGSSGVEVKEMQMLLRKHKAKNSTNKKLLVADGHFGETTHRRIREFQKAHGLVVDGICGNKTWSALEGS